MASKKTAKAGMTARQKKAALKKMPAKMIFEELERRGLTIGIDYEAVLDKVREDLFWLVDEASTLFCDESGDDAQLFGEFADNLDDVVWYIDKKNDTTGKEGGTPLIDYERILDGVDAQLNESEALFECNMMDFEDEGNREKMEEFGQRLGDIRWHITLNMCIEEYIRHEELSGKYK